MCVHLRREYPLAKLAPVSAGGFAAAAVLNTLTPADWSVSQEVEQAVVELTQSLTRSVSGDVRTSVQVVVHSRHIEIVVGADSTDWVTESVRIRPRRPFASVVQCAVERPGPPPARPALWPELAVPRGRESWATTYAALSDIVQSIRAADRLTPILDAVAAGIVNTTCFTLVAVNLVRPRGGVEVVAVSGDQDAREALLGVVESEADWRELIARGTGWGELRFTRGEDPLPINTTMATWQPPPAPGRAGRGWNPDDALLAPLFADGAFIGALSVDLPAGAARPRAEDLAKLELFAEHAAVAVERARAARPVRTP